MWNESETSLPSMTSERDPVSKILHVKTTDNGQCTH
jgi:hypothetical protein